MEDETKSGQEAALPEPSPPAVPPQQETTRHREMMIMDIQQLRAARESRLAGVSEMMSIRRDGLLSRFYRKTSRALIPLEISSIQSRLSEINDSLDKLRVHTTTRHQRDRLQSIENALQQLDDEIRLLASEL